MKKKTILCIIMSSLLISSAFAATYAKADTKDKMLEQANPILNVNLDLASRAVASAGFCAEPVTDFSKGVPVLSSVVIDQKNAETNTFYSKEFYSFLSILCGASNTPTLSFKINSHMTDTDAVGKVKWKVSWKKQGEELYSDANSITSADTAVTKQFFPEVSQVVEGNVLQFFAQNLVLKAETVDPYWNSPILAYSADLWLIMEAK